MSGMRTYTAFGLDVASTIEFPELAQAHPFDRSAADVVIDRGTVDRPPSLSTDDTLHCASSDVLYLAYPVGDVRVRDGREITVDPVPGASPGVVRSVVVGPAFNHLLHQRGYFVLHASTVSIDGDAVAFVGDSGDGKSTTASAFLRRGHRVLSDDVAAVRPGEDGPAVAPGYPSIKLDPEAVSALSLPVDERGQACADRDRRFYRLPHGLRDSPASFRRVYLLTDGRSTEVESVSSGEGIVELVRHTYTAGMLADRDEATENFERCSRLADDVEVQRLRRPRALDDLPAVVRTVEEDLAGAA